MLPASKSLPALSVGEVRISTTKWSRLISVDGYQTIGNNWCSENVTEADMTGKAFHGCGI